MNVIATWMYSSPPGENIIHPQVGAASSAKKTQLFYWRCVFLLFESSARINSNARHILFINKDPPVAIDGIDTRALLKQYWIEVVQFPTITKSPPDYYRAWNTQFIVLDVLEWLEKNIGADDALYILDSDMIFNKPIAGEMQSALQTHGALLYSIDYGLAYNINGLTRKDLLQIARELDPGLPVSEFIYSGGEFICCLARELPKIAKLARTTYHICLQRHAAGQKKFNEEAHLLSYVYARLGYKTHTGNRFVKRIWVDRSAYSNVDGTEDDLVLWHLPSEKKRGFVKVFRSYRQHDGQYELTIRNFAEAYGLRETFGRRVTGYGRTLARRAYRLLEPMVP